MPTEKNAAPIQKEGPALEVWWWDDGLVKAFDGGGIFLEKVKERWKLWWSFGICGGFHGDGGGRR